YFFCQAEDGIRDRNVTGVQTCALPISLIYKKKGGDNMEWLKLIGILIIVLVFLFKIDTIAVILIAAVATGLVSGLNLYVILETRSEERRVGTECRRRR